MDRLLLFKELLIESLPMKTRTYVLIAAGVASLSMGCKGSPAAPFNTLQDSQITVFRLQNYQEPVAATTTTQPTATTQPSLIPGLPGLPIPPEFQPQVQQAQTMICQMLPPGTPGCTATGQTTPQPAVAQNAPMFEGFRIIGQAQVMDPDLRESIIDIFGYSNNFDSSKSACMFPEFGMSFGGGGTQPSANLLISYSCNQVQARNFNWPHPDNGMKEKTVKNLNEIVRSLFGGG